jgi:hypothetical protein
MRLLAQIKINVIWINRNAEQRTPVAAKRFGMEGAVSFLVIHFEVALPRYFYFHDFAPLFAVHVFIPARSRDSMPADRSHFRQNLVKYWPVPTTYPATSLMPHR